MNYLEKETITAVWISAELPYLETLPVARSTPGKHSPRRDGFPNLVALRQADLLCI